LYGSEVVSPQGHYFQTGRLVYDNEIEKREDELNFSEEEILKGK